MTLAPTHVVAQNVLAMSNEPDSESAQVSQAVMGAPVQVLETREKYALIEGDDRYRGWVLSRWLVEPADRSDYPQTTIATLFCDVHTAPSHTAPLRTKLTAGARVVIDRQAELGEYVPLLLPTGETAYTHRVHLTSTYLQDAGAWEAPPASEESKRAVLHALIEQIGETAQRFIGTPYLWGGSTPFGIDCSGFTQLVYRLNGVLLLRDAYLQRDDRRFVPVDEGRPMAEAALAPGDLVFFGREGNTARSVTHVGLALGDGAFIHSVGGGRGNLISPCHDPDFTSIYLGARRLSPDSDLSIDAA